MPITINDCVECHKSPRLERWHDYELDIYCECSESAAYVRAYEMEETIKMWNEKNPQEVTDADND